MVRRLDGFETAKAEFHEVAGGERAFKLKAEPVTAQAVRGAGGAHALVTEQDRRLRDFHVSGELEEGAGVFFVLLAPGQRLGVNLWRYTGAYLGEQGVEVGHFHVCPFAARSRLGNDVVSVRGSNNSEP